MDAMMRKERIDRGLKVRTEGIYAISSLREILYLMGPRILLIVGLFALPFVFELAPYWKKVINIMCAYTLLALAFDFLANYVGLVCLGGAFFTGVGGYFASIFNTTLGLPIWLSMPLATIAGAVFCTVCLLPCLPLRGVYFAIVTLMYPLLFTRIIEALDILGGDLALCAGFFDHTDRRCRDRGRRNAGWRNNRGIYPRSVVRDPACLRDIQDRHLLYYPYRFHRFQERGDYGLPSTEVSPI
jgi:hypothetical protein